MINFWSNQNIIEYINSLNQVTGAKVMLAEESDELFPHVNQSRQLLYYNPDIQIAYLLLELTFLYKKKLFIKILMAYLNIYKLKEIHAYDHCIIWVEAYMNQYLELLETKIANNTIIQKKMNLRLDAGLSFLLSHEMSHIYYYYNREALRRDMEEEKEYPLSKNIVNTVLEPFTHSLETEKKVFASDKKLEEICCDSMAARMFEQYLRVQVNDNDEIQRQYERASNIVMLDCGYKVMYERFLYRKKKYSKTVSSLRGRMSIKINRIVNVYSELVSCEIPMRFSFLRFFHKMLILLLSSYSVLLDLDEDTMEDGNQGEDEPKKFHLDAVFKAVNERIVNISKRLVI